MGLGQAITIADTRRAHGAADGAAREVGSALLDRPRLTRTWKELLKRRLTLVCAPAGYGKSTLLGQWRALLAADVQSVWLTLDGSIDTGHRLLTGLCKAFAQIDAGIASFMQSQLAAVPPLDTKDLSEGVASIAADAENGIVVFVDDVQEIGNDEVEGWLRHLVLTMPPTVHWVLASREAPLWALGRLRALGEAHVIDAEQLSFSRNEIEDYLEATGCRLDISFVDELQGKTQGWIMAVQLAALGAAGQSGVSRLRQQDFANRDLLFSYFEDVILGQLTPHVRDFLFATAWLQPFCASLAATATAMPDSGAIVDQLLAKNLFISATEPSSVWFHYHPLFREFLQSRAARLQINKKEIHARASAWFEEEGLLVEALAHAFSGNDLERAERLVEGSLDGALSSGEIALAWEWLDQLDEDFICARPMVLRSVIWAAIISYRLAEASEWIRRGNKLLENPLVSGVLPPEAFLELRYHLEAAELIIARSCDNGRPDPGPYIKLLNEVPDRCLMVRALLQLDLGGVYFERGELERALATYRAGQVNCAAIGFKFGELNALSHRATILHLQGQLSAAETVCLQALELCADDQGRAIPMAGWAHLALAEIYYERGELMRARAEIASAEELVHKVNNVDWTVRLLETQAALAGRTGSYSDSAELLTTAEQIAIRRQSSRNLLRLRGRLGELAAFERDPVLASQYFEAVGLQADAPLPSAPITTIDLRNGLHFAVYLILTRRAVLAAKWLRPILNAAQTQGFRPGAALSALLLAIVYREDAGDCDEVDRLLKLGLTLAEETGIVRLLADRAALLRPLLAYSLPRLAEGSAPRRYAAYLLDIMNDVDAGPPSREAASAVRQMVQSDGALTGRESDILCLIASGLRNRQIAEQLHIAETTLRWHITNLYEKLQIRTRTQAVLEAQRRGLVKQP